ncbi:PREDICTED: calmodulin-binding protein 60 G-like [Prunus mume]|uniref:Calmodulin-binding protein 60 G-like n=1 Tax=Prunus mume TaxID=102107 RepID=A0ABM0PWS5_PRUMU|nr:PREDICTED: calmodulin-binding protein 60 G-like [Prunus mume]
MVPKRHFHEEGGEDFEFPVPESKRRPTFKNVVRDVMRDVTVNQVEWEHFFRKVVREEVERVIIPFLKASPRPPLESGSSSGGRGLQLRFINKLPSTIFTGSRVEAEDGTPLQIILIDASTNSIVRSSPLSSIKIELLVLNGEFGSDDQEDWTEKEFNNYVVREREGKRPLVTGEINITLREGVGSLGDVVFTDNSSWIRCRKFRLAARVVAKAPSEVRIREARSEPFVVKDHRGELYRKHHPPSLNDEIWRLEKIAKEGAFHKRLSRFGIDTVKDFLQSYVKDPSWLRNIFEGISNRTWEIIIEHAKACEIDDHKFYAYHRTEQDVSLLFNSIYKVVGAMVNGQYCSLDELTPLQTNLVENLKQHAYRNVRDIVPVDTSAIFALSRPLASLQAESFNVPNPDLQQIDLQFTQQDEPSMQLGFNQASTSTSCPYQPEVSNHLVVSLAQASHPMQVFTPALRSSFSMEDFNSMHYNGESSWPPLNGFQVPIVPSAHLGTENLFQVQTSTWSPTPTSTNVIWGQANSFCFGSSNNGTEAGHFPHISGLVHNSGTRKPKACWCKLRAAIKWWVSVRRDVAARRMARPLYLDY